MYIYNSCNFFVELLVVIVIMSKQYYNLCLMIKEVKLVISEYNALIASLSTCNHLVLWIQCWQVSIIKLNSTALGWMTRPPGANSFSDL